MPFDSGERRRRRGSCRAGARSEMLIVVWRWGKGGGDLALGDGLWAAEGQFRARISSASRFCIGLALAAGYPRSAGESISLSASGSCARPPTSSFS
jgi:hypothetical protein